MRFVLVVAAMTLAACSPPEAAKAPEPAPRLEPITAPAGDYVLDLGHSSLEMSVNHSGLSRYRTRFIRFDAKLRFDPDNPAAQSVEATIDAASIHTGYPYPERVDFDAEVRKLFLDAAAHPTITFRSTKVEPTGPRAARVTGDLTFRGVTRPVVLNAIFNGGYPAGETDPQGARIGFSAEGTFKRSAFGSTASLPPPGSTLGAGDEVTVTIEAEFTRK